jgi:hypothetical protein
MSNVGQAVLTVVGTVVGAYFGDAGLGFTLGSMASPTISPYDAPRKNAVSIPLETLYQDASSSMLTRRSRE